jgi:1,4-dihydroxy-6-naphthoate synthase
MVIRVAHSPDADDAFMFYALAKGCIDTGDRVYEHELQDIETLNRWALEGRYEVTAVSIHAYAYLTERYALLSVGASMGERDYGPRLVARRPLTPEQVRGVTVAVPGTLTSAYLVLKLFAPEIKTVTMPFDAIPDAVAHGQVEAGLLIHEAQLTYGEQKLHLVLDFGAWWHERHGLPLPLGGNVVRRDLGPGLTAAVADDLRRAIRYSLDHRAEALAYALGYSGGLSAELGDRFVGMYVNERTLDYGEPGREAVRRLLREGCEQGIIPHAVEPQFVG